MNSTQELLDRLDAHAERLAEIPGCPPVERTRQALIGALAQRATGEEDAPPVTIAIIGGTGVGKSTLFNALVGDPEASSASGERRAWTTAPVVATARPEVPRALFGDIAGTKYYSVPRWPRIALIDLPDINSNNAENRRIAARGIEEAKVLLFVTSPERAGDAEIIDMVRRYRTCQWLFVLNKIDQISHEDREALRNELHGRLARHGFVFSRSRIHCVCARDTQTGDFARLREYIESERLASLRDGIEELDKLGRIQIALQTGLSEELRRRIEVLSARRGEIREQWQELYEKALVDENEPLVAYLRGRLVDHAWQWSARRTLWPVGLAIEVRNRIAMLQVTWLVMRQFFGGPSPFGLYRLGRLAGGALAGMAERAQMEEMLEELAGPESRATERTVRHTLEEQGLQAFLPAPVEEVPAATEPEPAAERVQVPGLAALNRQLANLNAQAQRLFRRPAAMQDVCTAILRRIEEAGRRIASRRIFTALSLLNIPAWGFLGWVLWLLAERWYQGEYLPGSFYMHTAILLILYLLVVLLLWHGAIRFFARREEITPESLSDLQNPAIEPLDKAIDTLQSAEAEHDAVEEDVRRTKHDLRAKHHLEESLSTAME